MDQLGTLFEAVNKTSVGGKKAYLRLKFLPDTANRDTDALLLLIYGYSRIYYGEVGIGKVEQSLIESGCCQDEPLRQFLGNSLLGAKQESFVDELARSPLLVGKLSQKLGLAQGGYYRLTDTGETEASALFEDLVRRA